MGMKKRIIAIIIAATMSLGLMACGADNKKAEATEKVATETESEYQDVVEPTEAVQKIEHTEATSIAYDD
jgi:Flp pilus assembly protein TadD